MRVDGPEPRGEGGRRKTGELLAEKKDGDAGERGKKAIEKRGGYECGKCERPKDFEDDGDEERIDGREPGGGAGVATEDVGETRAFGERSGDASGFLGEGDLGEDAVWNDALLVP